MIAGNFFHSAPNLSLRIINKPFNDSEKVALPLKPLDALDRMNSALTRGANVIIISRVMHA